MTKKFEWLEFVRSKLLDVSVFIKIIGISVGIIIFFGIITLYIIRIVLYKSMTENLLKTWNETGKNIAGNIVNKIILNDSVGINNETNELIALYKDLRYIIIMDKNFQIIDSSFGLEIPEDLYKVNNSNFGKSSIIELKTDEGTIYDIAIPILLTSPNTKINLGVIRIGVKEKYINEAINKILFKIAFFMFLIIMFSIFISFIVAKILYEPISKLTQGVEQISKGRYKVRLKPWAKDELGKLTEAFNKMAESLEIKEKELAEKEKIRVKLMEKIISSQEEERARLSRELHDTVNQLFSSIKISLQSFQNICQTEKLKNKFKKIKDIINQAIDEIHHISLELRPPILRDFGLFRAVRKYLNDFQKYYKIKTSMKTNFNEDLRLNEKIELSLFRIIQEALTNIYKHSNATEAEVKFFLKKDILNLIIQDNGQGFQKTVHGNDVKHLGVIGMKERINIIGGKINIISKLGQGVKICISIKIK
jgi:signal transduction histidine kinase